ncbi:D-Ala-D-Ala carboxypeptidase family metallohydrolase [Catellatospora chokoriensis]|uniref:Muramoylpentapeptide carboxypeptidase n=1 Tax=Catellatospora chokoriensis TaxID=310353 RepID=A0A8J3JLH9_9ACTN|nr:D-Ala-D-Ala carboxypeptidase family metallohydrolase [Catellatospora chokoriensis]GIF87062.1 muramoylpentapeptide carboxypeptidase [Catellatospora chokoriensis]
MSRRFPRNALTRAFTVLVMAAIGSVAAIAVGASPAYADGCYTWGRSLSSGMSGEDVRQLQIRVAGWPGYNNTIGIDGVFGAETRDAVIRFQQAYGLGADGIAGPQTFSKIYSLQDDDCTPIHFSYAELNKCNTTWAGGAVSAATAKSNALRAMWRLEALRHALGDQALRVTSGFRSTACNNAAGGVSGSRHLYGDGVDLGSGPHSLCTIGKQARYHGFTGILGPGYPDHSDHIHTDARSGTLWSASQCF